MVYRYQQKRKITRQSTYISLMKKIKSIKFEQTANEKDKINEKSALPLAFIGEMVKSLMNIVNTHQ